MILFTLAKLQLQRLAYACLIRSIATRVTPQLEAIDFSELETVSIRSERASSDWCCHPSTHPPVHATRVALMSVRARRSWLFSSVWQSVGLMSRWSAVQTR